jgi:hypothetical protein
MPPEVDPTNTPTNTPATTEPTSEPKTEPKTEPKAEPEQGENYWRRQAEKHAAEIKRLSREKLSELDRLKAEAEDYKTRAESAEGELTSFKTVSQFREVATKFEVLDFESVQLHAKGKVSLDSNGNLVGAEAFLKNLRQSKPHLFKSQNIGGGGRGGSGSGGSTSSLNSEIRRIAGKE